MLVTLKSPISLPPKYMGPEIKKSVENKLTSTYTRTILKDIGRIEEIVDVIDISKGHINSITNYIDFQVTYTANVFLPKIGDVCKCVVQKVVDVGVMCNYKNMDVFIPTDNLEKDLEEYKTRQILTVELMGVQMEEKLLAYGQEVNF